MNCEYKDRCIVFQKYNDLCHDDDDCEIARMEREDEIYLLDEAIKRGEICLIQAQMEKDRLYARLNINEVLK